MNIDMGLPPISACILTTIKISFFTAFFTTIWGLFASFILAKTQLSYKLIWIFLVVFGLIIPSHSHATTALLLLGRNGICTHWLWKDFTIYSDIGVIWISTITHLPLSTTICYLGFCYIPSNLEEQTSLYLTDWQRIFWVILPQSWPFVGISFVLVFVLESGNMAVCDILNIPTLARQIYLCIGLFYRLDWACILASPLLLFLILAIFLIHMLCFRGQISEIGYTQAEIPMTYKIPKYLLIPMLLACFPYTITYVGLLYGVQEWHFFIKVIQTTWPEICHSLFLACIATTWTTGCGFFLAYQIWQKNRYTKLWIFFIGTLLTIPSALLAIAILRILQTGIGITGLSTICLYIRDSDIGTIFGITLHYLPYATLFAWLGFMRIPKILCEQMSVLGYSNIQQVWPILGMLSFSIIGTWLLTFGFCLGELEITLLLIPPGTSTIPIRIFTLMHYGVRNDVCCATLLVLCLQAIGSILCLRFFSKQYA